jgi:hypothetical protein
VTLARLRWSVAAEVVTGVAVLAVTAVLVNTATGRESYTPPLITTVPFNGKVPGGSGAALMRMTTRPGLASPTGAKRPAGGRVAARRPC